MKLAGFVAVLGIAIIGFAMFGIPHLAGEAYQWWMGFFPGMVGGALISTALTGIRR